MQKKATIDAKAFSEGLDQVSKALQKSSYPALSEVSVRVEDGVCILTATDLDTWLIKRIPAQETTWRSSSPAPGSGESLPPV